MNKQIVLAEKGSETRRHTALQGSNKVQPNKNAQLFIPYKIQHLRGKSVKRRQVYFPSLLLLKVPQECNSTLPWFLSQAGLVWLHEYPFKHL